jgi:VanZ family protein
MTVIFVFSSVPRPLAPLGGAGEKRGVSKLLHFGEYAILTVLLYRAARNGKREVATSVGVGAAYAVLDELHQELVPGRYFQWSDIGFDLLGVLAGVLWAAWFHKKKTVNSHGQVRIAAWTRGK